MQTIAQILATELAQPVQYVENVIALLDEGNTIPFIARYRKEQHGSMDDTALRKLEDRLRYLRNLAARLRRQAEQRLAEDLDTREIKELTAVLRELMNLQQTLEGQQPGGSPLRVVLEEETEDWSV